MPDPRRRSLEAGLLGFLALFAAARVLGLALALPFFNNVDEVRHYDVVRKLAHGRLPHPDALRFDPAVLRTALLWGSPEFLAAPGEAVPAPPGRDPAAAASPGFRQQMAELGRLLNTAVQPPVYYALAAGWWRLGHGIGLREPGLVYWTRGLGAFFAGGLVLLAHALLARSHGDDALLRLGVPALLAVFPQDAWLSITNDALSPLAFGAAFAALCAVRTGEARSLPAAAGAGLLVGLTFLVKYTNVAIVAVALWAWGARWAGATRRPERAEWRRAALFWGCAALPLLPGCARNAWLFGELLAASIPLESAGWMRKPLADFLPHPLFGLGGARHFLEELAVTFWRGEFVWYGERLQVAWADVVYRLTSGAWLVLAGLHLVLRREPTRPRRVEGLAAVAVLAAVATLVGLTLAYRFPEHGVPTRDDPYVVLGRYVGGAVLPFLILYVRGIRVLAERLPASAREPVAWGLLLATAATALVSEALVHAPVLASPYNAFHGGP